MTNRPEQTSGDIEPKEVMLASDHHTTVNRDPVCCLNTGSQGYHIHSACFGLSEATQGDHRIGQTSVWIRPKSERVSTEESSTYFTTS